MKTMLIIFMLCFAITITKDWLGDTIIRDSGTGEKIRCSTNWLGDTVCN